MSSPWLTAPGPFGYPAVPAPTYLGANAANCPVQFLHPGFAPVHPCTGTFLPPPPPPSFQAQPMPGPSSAVTFATNPCAAPAVAETIPVGPPVHACCPPSPVPVATPTEEHIKKTVYTPGMTLRKKIVNVRKLQPVTQYSEKYFPVQGTKTVMVPQQVPCTYYIARKVPFTINKEVMVPTEVHEEVPVCNPRQVCVVRRTTEAITPCISCPADPSQPALYVA